MVDGNVELGNYSEAVVNSDKMISIRPDIRSYSRISYLREIHGDYPGAIEAMKMAVDAGPPGDESTEWARVQLGRLYELTGSVREAEMHYTIALNERPGFSPSLAGLARLAMDKKEFDKSIALFKQADSTVNDYSVEEQMAELYQYLKQEKRADEILEKIIKELKTAGENGGNHHVDKELSTIYLMKHDFDLALKHAQNEYNTRPENIDVNETMAWAHFKKGNASSALPFIEKALRTNSRNPQLLCRAGTIYAANGNKEKARNLLQEGLKNNPVMELRLKEDSKKLLSSL
jgi:tetratricopeptide (TPR) repeat protein